MVSSFIPQPQTLGFLTDFGHSDSYGGQLKCAALSLLTPLARSWTTLVDLTHGISKHDIWQGAFQLRTSISTLPAHSTVVCVVDPDVGSENQAHLFAYRPEYQQAFIGPDNSLLDPIIQDYQLRVYTITNTSLGWPQSTGNTFKGRDLYVPVAAHWINAQVDNRVESFLDTLGELQTEWTRLKDWQGIAELNEAGQFKVTLLHEDSFGNLITNLPLDWWPVDAAVATLQLDKQKGRVPVVSSYAEGGKKSQGAFLVPGSSGHWEVAMHQRSAAETLQLTVGAQLLISPY